MTNANMTDAMVDHHALRRPDDVALVDERGSTTYVQLASDVNAIAYVLSQEGVQAGDRVALYGRNSSFYAVAALAVWKIGAVLVPVNFRFQADEIRHLLNHAEVSVVIAEKEYLPLVESVQRDVASHRTTYTYGSSDASSSPNLALLSNEARGSTVETFPASHDDLHRIMYTSGTTNRPKGVVYTHGMVAFNVLAQTRELGLTAADRILVSSPLYHVAGMDAPGFSALFHGGRMVIMRRFEPKKALRFISEQKITGGIMIQTMLHMLRDVPDDIDVSSLRFLVFGAASGELYREIQDRFPTTNLVQAYGLTEGCSAVTYMDPAHARDKLGTTGSTVPFVDLRIVDDCNNEVVPGVEGEILIRGAKVTPGYWRDPDPAATAIGGGWLRTGDVGMVDQDGFLTITDRKKDMIRSGGENVASQEIERVIYEHPDVLECAAVAAPDEHWGEIPRVFVVTRNAGSVDADGIMEHCRSLLAHYKVPRYIEFLPTLPRNASGKVMKAVLRDMPIEQ